MKKKRGGVEKMERVEERARGANRGMNTKRDRVREVREVRVVERVKAR